MAKGNNVWDTTALVLACIGAINWVPTRFGWNLVGKLIGSWSPLLATIVYVVIAIAGIWTLIRAFK